MASLKVDEVVVVGPSLSQEQLAASRMYLLALQWSEKGLTRGTILVEIRKTNGPLAARDVVEVVGKLTTIPKHAEVFPLGLY